MRSPVLRRAWCCGIDAFGGDVIVAAASVQRRARPTSTVIGEPPKVVDPAAGALTESQAVLLVQRRPGPGAVRRLRADRARPRGALERHRRRAQLHFPPAGGELAGRPEDDRAAGRPDPAAAARRREATIRSRTRSERSTEIVPMTDRVIEISLKAPRPHLLQLLAQPEFAIVREDQGTGPFRMTSPTASRRARSCSAPSQRPDEEVTEREEVVLAGRPAPAAVQAFLDGRSRPGARRNVRRPALRAR